MTPTMSESSKIRELKERAIYKLTLRYGRPFVVFLNTPRLAGAIGSRPEDGNKQIPASVQQLTRAIRSDGVSLEDITRYAKYADSMQSMRMDSDKLKGLLRDERTGSGSGSGSGILSSAYGYLTGRSPTDSGDPIETVDTLRAQVQGLKNKLNACETADNREQLQQAMQKLLECKETVARLSQEIQNYKDSSRRFEDQLREERTENERLLSMLSAEAQATEREKKRNAEMRRAAEEQQRQEAAAVTTRVRDRLATERQDPTRLEAGRRSADARGRERSIGVIPRGAPQGTRTVFGDDEETKENECGDLPAGFVPVTAENFMPVPTAKKISEFANLVGYSKDMILVYSNKSDWTGGKIYCPVVSINITPGRQKDEVTVDKRGVATTLKIGTDIKKEDIFVNEAGFTEFLAGRTPVAPARTPVRTAPLRRSTRITPPEQTAPAPPATPPEPTRTPARTPASNTRTRIRFDDDGSATRTQESVTDPFAGIQGQTPVAQTAPAQVETQKGCEYGSVASAPLGLLGATTLDGNADIEVIFEYASRVGLKKEKILYRSKADDGSTFNVYSGSAYCPIEQWDRVGNDMVLSSRTIATADIVVANFYVSAEDFWVPLTKASDAKKGYLFRNSNGAIVGISEGQKGSYVGIEGQTGKRATGAYQRKPSEAEAQTYQSAAPTQAAAPAPAPAPAVRRSTRSTTQAAAPAPVPAPAPAPSSSTPDYKSMSFTAVKKLAKDRGIGVTGDKRKKATFVKALKKADREGRLIGRIENFEGIDGVVPALPSIRIPERHEM